MENHVQLRVRIFGAVQGVGFRPFVYGLATARNFGGWVLNSSQGVQLRVEGKESELKSFLQTLQKDKPALARILSMEHSWATAEGFENFSIVESDDSGERQVFVLPDVATCPDCLAEIFAPNERRFRYPFTNCTHCGPRFSIICDLPYDRPNTSMVNFPLCDECREEYENPADRRFHAQPVACPNCGPRVWLENRRGEKLKTAVRDPAMRRTAELLRQGYIVAVKGLGGYQMVCDARSEGAVQELRKRKGRGGKPFALMMGDVSRVSEFCELDSVEKRALCSSEAPIVLLQRKNQKNELAASVAPGSPLLGVMLPATPLHHILARDTGFPLVVTSGNLSEEPICINENEARHRLAGLADFFLHHDRPILRHVDDSIVRIIAGRQTLLRRARGFAPLPVEISFELSPVLAVGAHLKNTIAVGKGRQVFLSQHIGDLENSTASDCFRQVSADLQKLLEIELKSVRRDLHPDYFSSREGESIALSQKIPLQSVQHHHAHALACLAENAVRPPALAVVWDGTGLGSDGTVWGGEFLEIDEDLSFRRVGCIRPFLLPGGDAAAQEPARCALALLFEIFGRELPATPFCFSKEKRELLIRMMTKGLNSPKTTSMGRLFDGVAALAGFLQSQQYEGEAAMSLEFAAMTSKHCDAVQTFTFLEKDHPLCVQAGVDWIADWEPLIRLLLKTEKRMIPLLFHRALADLIVDAARRFGQKQILFSGGCFQNAVLVELAENQLQKKGFRVYRHQRVPSGDGGIALGQAVFAGKS